MATSVDDLVALKGAAVGARYSVVALCDGQTEKPFEEISKMVEECRDIAAWSERSDAADRGDGVCDLQEWEENEERIA